MITFTPGDPNSHVKKVVYDQEKKELTISFTKGTYMYEDVSETLFTQLTKASSTGSFVSKNIVGRFITNKLEAL